MKNVSPSFEYTLFLFAVVYGRWDSFASNFSKAKVWVKVNSVRRSLNLQQFVARNVSMLLQVVGVLFILGLFLISCFLFSIYLTIFITTIDVWCYLTRWVSFDILMMFVYGSKYKTFEDMNMILCSCLCISLSSCFSLCVRLTFSTSICWGPIKI